MRREKREEGGRVRQGLVGEEGFKRAGAAAADFGTEIVRAELGQSQRCCCCCCCCGRRQRRPGIVVAVVVVMLATPKFSTKTKIGINFVLEKICTAVTCGHRDRN